MSLFIRREHVMPELNTSSLPDMIFTVLFFFIIVTTMREVELKVRYTVPEGQRLERLTKKSTVTYIYIGKAAGKETASGEEPVRIQVNDRIVDVDDIADYIHAERSRMAPEDIRNMKVCIKADRSVPMGMIDDVKQVLRRSNVLNIVYSAEFNDNY